MTNVPTPDPVGAGSGFSSVYGQLMTLSGRLSGEQMTALRELDGMLAAAEHAMAGTPVGAGAHSTICGMIMNAYAQGAKDERRRIRQLAAEVDAVHVTRAVDVLVRNALKRPPYVPFADLLGE